MASEAFGILTAQSGQTVADLALQAYGTASVEAMNTLVTDNPAILTDGIATLVPAGVPIKYRTDADFANTQVKTYFGSRVINSTYQSGTSQVDLPTEEDEVTDVPSTTQLVVGKRDQWRIEVHFAWRELTEVFGGSVVVLANGAVAEAAMNFDVMDHVEFEPRLGSEISARYDGDNIILMLNTEDVSVLKYKIVSAI